MRMRRLSKSLQPGEWKGDEAEEERCFHDTYIVIRKWETDIVGWFVGCSRPESASRMHQRSISQSVSGRQPAVRQFNNSGALVRGRHLAYCGKSGGASLLGHTVATTRYPKCPPGLGGVPAD